MLLPKPRERATSVKQPEGEATDTRNPSRETVAGAGLVASGSPKILP
jgi:hypothetical protein